MRNVSGTAGQLPVHQHIVRLEGLGIGMWSRLVSAEFLQKPHECCAGGSMKQALILRILLTIRLMCVLANHAWTPKIFQVLPKCVTIDKHGTVWIPLRFDNEGFFITQLPLFTAAHHCSMAERASSDAGGLTELSLVKMQKRED
ncbi:MAG: hypothetical protein FD164_1516 [Nitrospirae bacterium]|nr:MAG: hypothetical protein FD164_1516 [Nitrospirota bacterium]